MVREGLQLILCPQNEQYLLLSLIFVNLLLLGTVHHKKPWFYLFIYVSSPIFSDTVCLK